jgi:hypothetical protein
MIRERVLQVVLGLVGVAVFGRHLSRGDVCRGWVASK